MITFRKFLPGEMCEEEEPQPRRKELGNDRLLL